MTIKTNMFRYISKKYNKIQTAYQTNTRKIKSCIDNIHMHILAASNSMDDYLLTTNNSNENMSVEDKIDTFHNLINNTIDTMIRYCTENQCAFVDLKRTVYDLFNIAIEFKIDKIDINLLKDEDKIQIVHIANVMRDICKNKILNIRIYLKIKEIKNDSPFLELEEVDSAYEYIKSAISIAFNNRMFYREIYG